MSLDGFKQLEGEQQDIQKQSEVTKEQADELGTKTHNRLQEIGEEEKLDQVKDKLGDFGVSSEEKEKIIDIIKNLSKEEQKEYIAKIQDCDDEDEFNIIKERILDLNKTNQESKEAEQNNTEAEQNNTEAEQNNMEIEQTKANVEQQENKNDSFIKLLNLAEKYKGNSENFNKIDKILLNYKDISKIENKDISLKQYEKLYEDLKQALTPDKLQQISTELGPNTREFQEFKNSLIGLEGTNGSYFKTQFDMLERVGPKNASEFVKLGIDSGKIKTDSAGNTITQNGETNIIFDKNGNRTLSLKDSNYKLNSNIDTTKEIAQIGEIEAKAQKEFNEINDKINDLNSLKNIIIEYQNLDFEGLKIMLLANVDKFEKAGISRSVIENAEDSQTLLQNLDLAIAEKQKELQEQKDKKTKEIQKEIGV